MDKPDELHRLMPLAQLNRFRPGNADSRSGGRRLREYAVKGLPLPGGGRLHLKVMWDGRFLSCRAWLYEFLNAVTEARVNTTGDLSKRLADAADRAAADPDPAAQAAGNWLGQLAADDGGEAGERSGEGKARELEPVA